MKKQVLPPAGTHAISLARAIVMTARYRQLREQLLLPEYRGANILCISETFALQDVETLLQEAQCKGFRIYYGMKEDKTIHAILVGTDGEGNDLLPAELQEFDEDDDDDPIILQDGQRCPPMCPPPSPLNP